MFSLTCDMPRKNIKRKNRFKKRLFQFCLPIPVSICIRKCQMKIIKLYRGIPPIFSQTHTHQPEVDKIFLLKAFKNVPIILGLVEKFDFSLILGEEGLHQGHETEFSLVCS